MMHASETPAKRASEPDEHMMSSEAVMEVKRALDLLLSVLSLSLYQGPDSASVWTLVSVGSVGSAESESISRF